MSGHCLMSRTRSPLRLAVRSLRQPTSPTLGAYGRLDAAVNNAAGGGHRPTPLAEVAIEDVDSALTVSLRGVFLAIRYEIPAMLEAGAARS
jgi:NAD(P)-dependent dehydrogenase (short-subunit alcohol dehydrogenase family)